MIKAVKECLKNWLVTHERLYWYIIVGLAVFAFGLVTALGCAKLEKANAAETTNGIFYPELLKEVDLGTYEEQIYDICNRYQYFAVARLYNDSEYYRYCFFSDSRSKVFDEFVVNSSFAVMECDVHVVVQNRKVTYCDEATNLGMAIDIGSQKSDTFLIGTNFPIRYKSGLENNTLYTSFVDAQPCNNLVHPNDYVPEPLVLPVTESGYEYWLYHKTSSGEYMYWSKSPFDLEVSDGKYLLKLYLSV